MSLLPRIRRKYNLWQGETTVWFVSAGVGRNGQWHYSPYSVVRAHYRVANNATFALESIDTPPGYLRFSYQSSKIGQFSLHVLWNENNNPSAAEYGFDTFMNSRSCLTLTVPTVAHLALEEQEPCTGPTHNYT